MTNYGELIKAAKEYTRHEVFSNLRPNEYQTFDMIASARFRETLRIIYGGMDRAEQAVFLAYLDMSGIAL